MLQTLQWDGWTLSVEIYNYPGVCLEIPSMMHQTMTKNMMHKVNIFCRKSGNSHCRKHKNSHFSGNSHCQLELLGVTPLLNETFAGHDILSPHVNINWHHSLSSRGKYVLMSRYNGNIVTSQCPYLEIIMWRNCIYLHFQYQF